MKMDNFNTSGKLPAPAPRQLPLKKALATLLGLLFLISSNFVAFNLGQKLPETSGNGINKEEEVPKEFKLACGPLGWAVTEESHAEVLDFFSVNSLKAKAGANKVYISEKFNYGFFYPSNLELIEEIDNGCAVFLTVNVEDLGESYAQKPPEHFKFLEEDADSLDYWTSLSTRVLSTGGEQPGLVRVNIVDKASFDSVVGQYNFGGFRLPNLTVSWQEAKTGKPYGRGVGWVQITETYDEARGVRASLSDWKFLSVQSIEEDRYIVIEATVEVLEEAEVIANSLQPVIAAQAQQ